MVINLDSGYGSQFDVALKTITGLGVGGNDCNFRVMPEEQIHWVFDGAAGDEIVLTWTDPGTTKWGVEILLIPVKEVLDGQGNAEWLHR
jgi:hypothetical protein